MQLQAVSAAEISVTAGSVLIVGAVQGGKFTAIIFLIAAALDHGFHVIFILAGQTNTLRLQAEFRTGMLLGDPSSTVSNTDFSNDVVIWLTSSLKPVKGSSGDVDTPQVNCLIPGRYLACAPLHNRSCVCSVI